MTPFLYDELQDLAYRLISRVVKKEVLEKATHLYSIKLNEDNDLRTAKQFSLDFGIKTSLQTAKHT